MAWGANSGLTWDQKYQAWVESLEKIDAVTGYGSASTFMLKTPWGIDVPSPVLECAEVAIFLRIAFSSWYNLPFFLQARDREGRIYFGHFGMRRDDGKFGRMPNFKTRYPDYSNQAQAVADGGDWPSDEELFKKAIPGSFDDAQPQLELGDVNAGAYMDRVFLNKRVGHFLILTLAWFGSINLADSSNTFNMKPEGVSPGDVLVERWQREGIGHTLIVMRKENVGSKDLPDGSTIAQLEVQVASGSMPRRQPVWESPGATKRYFLLEATGGPDTVEFGGGLKRWRTAKNINGRWTNVIMPAYADFWVNSRNKDDIAGRLETFEQLLVELSPDQKRDVLLEIIESKRQHLQQFPASCSARINREDAFESLYELMAEEFNMSQADVDNEYRTLEDYVFAKLEYSKSKTCCWNRSTNAMYDIIMDYNIKAQQDATMCVAPVVFMNRDDSADGYQMFREHAISLGREAEWAAWSEDESCAQRDVATDTIASATHLTYCALDASGSPPEDPMVRDTQVIKLALNPGAIPDNDPTGLRLEVENTQAGQVVGAVLDIDIQHTWRGDLQIVVIHPDGTEALVLEPDSNDGDDVVERFQIADFFQKDALGVYTVVITDTAAQDEGGVRAATLELTVAQ